MANYDEFKIGEVVSPLSSISSNPLLIDADPALNAIVKYLQACIKTHAEARFVTEALAVNYKQADKVVFSNLVPTALHYDPVPFFTQSQYKFPLLAVYWTGTTKVEPQWSQAYYMRERKLNLIYVLPPFDIAQAFALDPILNHVENVIINRLKLRYEPTYQDGYLVLDNAGICDIDFVESSIGEYKVRKTGATQDVNYPSLLIELRLREKQDYVANPSLSGVNVTQDITDDEGTQTIIESEYDNP